MACDFFTSATSNAVGKLMIDYLVKPVEHCLRHLFHFNKIVEKLKEQEKNLSKQQTRVQEDVQEAKRHIQTQVIEKYVEDWLTEAENVLNDVKSLERRIEENKRCFRWCPNWSWRYQLGKKIEKKRLAIRKLVESSKFDRYGHRAALPGIEFFESEGYLASKSSTSAFNEIMEALKDDGVNMIGVCGMGGVGKTTLVTEVGKKAKSLQLFHKVIKVVVSQTPIIENIQHKIADFLDLEFKKTTQEGKAEELWLRLKNEEKVLIILDDMWNELNLKEIGIPFGENREGCTIILTTRHMQVCNYMKSQLTVSLNVLEKDEAWILFKMNASLDNAFPDIIDVAKEVAKECDGLPIAIVTLARALRRKDLNGWELARDKLESSRLMDIENVPTEVQRNTYLCLEMSYNHLRSETTKRCFLLCALYPEDYSIDAEDLVRYAWGLRLYQNAGSIKEVRSEVFEAINNLKDSCLLLEDDQKRYIKVHDMVRDVALWIASKEDNGLVTKPGVASKNESSKQKLEILLLDNNDSKTPFECFEGMRELKVLSLRRASESNNSFFSLNVMKSLTNLRALQLEGFKQLEGISALAKLTKLEILSLHGSEFQESVDKLGALKNLRVLDIRQCKFLLGFPPNLIRKLVKMEELYLYYSTIKRLVFGGTTGDESISIAVLPELNFLPRLASVLLEVSSLHFPKDFVFPKLETYRIAINTCCQTDPKAISSRFLTISEELPLNVISELLWNVDFLVVSNIMEKDIKCLTDTTPGNVPVATILQNLKDVRIDKCKNLQVIFQMKMVENHALLLSKLKDLCLSKLPNLEYIWKMPKQHVSLQSLEVVKLDHCGKLKSLFSFSLAQCLIRLQLLEINGCGELEQIVQELEGDEQEISPSMNPNQCLCLPKLRFLEIYNCDSLEYIFPSFMAPQGLPQLQNLWMACLSQLKQICRPAMQREENGILLPQLQLLPSLTELRLSNCPRLTDATVHAKPMRAYLEDIQLSKLKEALFIKTQDLFLRGIKDHNLIPEVDREGLNELALLELRYCNSLEYLVDTTKEHVSNRAFSNLVQLYLRGMGGLKKLCNGQLPKGFLQNLKKLTIHQCPQLQELFQIDEEFCIRAENQAQLLSNLEHLVLVLLPELRWIVKGPVHYFSPLRLKVVNIFSCKKLKSIFSSSLIQSLLQLEELRIENCDELKTLFAELERDGQTEPNSYLHPLCMPKLKSVRIFKCSTLEYVLPVTLAQGLQQLESIWVSMSPQLKQVFGVTKEHDRVEHCIKLPRLKDLGLNNLTNLSSFGPESYIVKAPALEKVFISASPQLKKFTIQQEVNNRVHLEGVRLFVFKDFLRNTKDLSLHRIMDQKNLIPDVNLEGLTSLNLKGCKDLECLADTTEEHVPTSGMFTNLVELVMENMIGLKMLCNGHPPECFLPNLEILTVNECLDIISLYPVAQNLKKLFVKNCGKLQEVFRIDELLYNREGNQARLLSNLDYLELWSVPELRWILKGPTHYVSLRSLKVVKVRSCSELKFLFSASVIPTLRLLEELQIGYCDKLECVFMELESDDDQIESNTLCLPNLKTVEINDCPRLEYVFPVALNQGLPRLQKLQLCCLANLSSFGPENYFIKAPALENLEVTHCPRLSNFTIQQEKPLQSKELVIGFEECIDDAESCNSQLIERSSNLEYITSRNFEQLFLLTGGYNFMSSLETMELGGLIWLRDIWRGSIQVVVTNLRVLRLHDCNRLTYIFPLMLFRNLPKLSILKIWCCKNLEQITASDDNWASTSQQSHEQDETGVKNKKEMLMFPQLKNLCLEGLPSLMSFSPVGYHLIFPSLDSLKILDCSQMITSFTVDSTLSVHAKTKAPRLDETSPSERDISWTRHKPTSLPPHVEEPDEISPLK